MSPEERLQNRREYERNKNRTPERKELNRQISQAKRQEAKSLGLCIVCGDPPIPNETRCKTCAENHRVSRRQSQQRPISERDQASGQATFL